MIAQKNSYFNQERERLRKLIRVAAVIAILYVILLGIPVLAIIYLISTL